MLNNKLNLKKLLNKPIIDIRSTTDYINGHILGASHFPLKMLKNRLHELPTNEVPLNLFGSAEQLLIATEFLKQKKYQINQMVELTPNVMEEMKSLKIIEKGKKSKTLWKPSDVVKEFICTQDKNKIGKKGLDLACGSGRDSVYMSLNGWSMTSVDYKKSALDKLKKLSVHHAQKVMTYSINLENNLSELLELNQQYDVIIIVRYLHRPLFKELKSLIQQDGFIIYQTFMEGCERFGSPKNPRFILKKSELSEIFNDFKIILDRVVYLNDGRPTNCFIAQKV